MLKIGLIQTFKCDIDLLFGNQIALEIYRAAALRADGV